ncbi:RING/U-box superfamily protein [Abeliophyllum distichum]|uniref:E3 ubiquitin-protein ligase RMA n=1 Tax=Abeliophyllum distichum TaxID=126358 RepID=A0ABD1RSS2_9LAMI
MGDDSLRGNNLTDLDLNEQSLDPHVDSVVRIGSSLNELETDRARIEERIRQLAFVAIRASGQKSHQVTNSMEIRNFLGETLVIWDGEKGIGGNDRVNVEERTSESRKGFESDSSHLVGKALKMLDYEVKNVDKEGGSFYDCNICLDLAKDPVLTCCGHMFCWVCFYLVSYVDSTTKECPVCKGEVSDSTLIPIYGNGSREHVSELECGFMIPPRPKARRVESVRLQGVGLSLSYASVAQALRQIRISTGAMGNQTGQEGGNGNFSLNSESHGVQNAEVARSRLIQAEPRVLSERAASLYSLSSSMINVSRSVEDRETVVNNRFQGSDARTSFVGVGNSLTSNFTAVRSYNQPSDSRFEINSSLPISSSSQASVSGAVARFLTMRTVMGMNFPVDPSPSSWRRTIRPRASDVDNGDSREYSRRRLN